MHFKENMNVICVDWEEYASKNYIKAAISIKDIGRQISELIKMINKEFKTEINENVHIIGFSLGAHIAGMAGFFLGGNIGRITGKYPKYFCAPNQGYMRLSIF